jgi:hypothetical protein
MFVRNEVLTMPPAPTWYVIPLTLNVSVRTATVFCTRGLAYLLRGVHDAALSESTAHLEELGPVLKPELMVDNVPRYSFPSKKIIFRGSIDWNEPFSVNVCVQLDVMRIAVVGCNIYTEV